MIKYLIFLKLQVQKQALAPTKPRVQWTSPAWQESEWQDSTCQHNKGEHYYEQDIHTAIRAPYDAPNIYTAIRALYDAPDILTAPSQGTL